MEESSHSNTIQARANRIIALLKESYPEARCTLPYDDPFQLLAATRLAAQCTDARVNQVTPALFARWPTPQAMAKALPEDVEGIIHSCGFYHAKARDLIAMAGQLMDRHNGVVPQSMHELLALQGVGRKTANLLRGDAFGLPAVVADTHLIRLSFLLGLVNTRDPTRVESQLLPLLPPGESNDFCHRCVLHGRAVCIARRPQCAQCCLKEECQDFQRREM